MDPKIAYWTGALVNLAVLTGLALSGLAAIRRGDLALHRRRMLMAAGLVAAFLVSYPLKLAWLGREHLEAWGAASVRVLRFHEMCVLVMVTAGAFAVRRGLMLARERAQEGEEGSRPESDSRSHRIAGRCALVGGLLGLVSSAFVLAGMYARL